MWETRAEEGLFSIYCLDCGSKLIGDAERGEQVCPSCGSVTNAREDEGPEWKAVDLEEKNKRVRVGSPTTLTLHDLGLSTDISMEMRDSHGKYLDPAMRATVEKMKKWQSRIRTSNSQERGLSIVLAKITEVCDNLSLPKNVAETAAHIYRTSVRLKVAKSKSIMGMTAAVVLLACRKCGVSRTLKEVARAAGIEKGAAAKYFRLILKDVEKDYVPPPSVEKHISKLVNIAKIDPRVEHLALYLSRSTNDSKISSGKAPAGLAAAYVYMSCVMRGEHLPQREIAEFAEVTEVTVRNRCRELLDNYIIRQKMGPAE
jgi:transcription initiation factor TFIIB